MKRVLMISWFVFAVCASIKAITYEEARREAWFLTDKMAYELNLTAEQTDLAYRVNLDYFLSIRKPVDCGGAYWHFRNEDFRCILFSWQFAKYVTLEYFYRPVVWLHSSWFYPVCKHYRRGHFYFERPVIYISYRGKNWEHRSRHARSPYYGMHVRRDVGLRDNFNRGREIRKERVRESSPVMRPPREIRQRNDGRMPERPLLKEREKSERVRDFHQDERQRVFRKSHSTEMKERKKERSFSTHENRNEGNSNVRGRKPKDERRHRP